MSRLVALEWDAKEARVVIGANGTGGVTVEQAFAVPLPQREEGSTAEPDVGGVLAKAPGRTRRGPLRSAWSPSAGPTSSCGSSPRRPSPKKSCPTSSAFRRCGSSRRSATIGRSISCRWAERRRRHERPGRGNRA